MRAVVITRPGGPEVLEVRDVSRPSPGYGQVLVRVRATALNRADILQREGRYPAPPDAPGDIPGLEFAGEVAEIGAGVRLWRVGQAVFGITGGGAYAEYLVTHERLLAEIPDLSWSAAAAVPEAFITAHDALVAQAAMRPSERVLIQAVGSGVGLAAVQLVRALGGTPYGTARSASKIEVARRLGLEDGVVVNDDLRPIAERAREWTRGEGVDVILDLVGGAYVAAGIGALAAKGRLILIGTLAGGQAQLPLGRVLGARLTIKGTVLRARALEEKIAATRAFAREVVPLLARRAVCPVVDSEFPLADVSAAHRRLESNATTGKVVLTIGD
jgi:putative PIG3 family NAD(P)H quinone oxidoreductase